MCFFGDFLDKEREALNRYLIYIGNKPSGASTLFFYKMQQSKNGMRTLVFIAVLIGHQLKPHRLKNDNRKELNLDSETLLNSCYSLRSHKVDYVK